MPSFHRSLGVLFLLLANHLPPNDPTHLRRQLLLHQSALRLTRQHLSKEGKRRLCLCGRARVLWLKLRFGLTPTGLARLLPLSRASIHRYRRGFRPGALFRGLLGIPPWNRSPADLEALI